MGQMLPASQDRYCHKAPSKHTVENRSTINQARNKPPPLGHSLKLVQKIWVLLRKLFVLPCCPKLVTGLQ